MVAKHFMLLKEYFKISLAAAMEYRLNFIIQTTAMFVNDVVWVFFWWIFFNRFNIVNGWTVKEIMMLYAVITFSWGIAGVFFGNRGHIAKIISEGRLDFYLSLPKGELFHILISRSSWFALGDLVFGLVVATYVFNLSQWPMFLLVCVFSTIIILAASVIFGSLAFFIGNAEELARTMNMSLISFASYPLPIFKGVAKVLLLTIVPAGFITSIPVELIRKFDPLWFLGLVGATAAFVVIAIAIFKIGLKKYESGSMITIRI